MAADLRPRQEGMPIATAADVDVELKESFDEISDEFRPG
jgi:hypothetical protein